MNRESAMEIWNKLSLEDKFFLVIPWLKSQEINVTERHPNSLTGREIEEVITLSEKNKDSV